MVASWNPRVLGQREGRESTTVAEFQRVIYSAGISKGAGARFPCDIFSVRWHPIKKSCTITGYANSLHKKTKTFCIKKKWKNAKRKAIFWNVVFEVKENLKTETKKTVINVFKDQNTTKYLRWTSPNAPAYGRFRFFSEIPPRSPPFLPHGADSTAPERMRSQCLQSSCYYCYNCLKNHWAIY